MNVFYYVGYTKNEVKERESIVYFMDKKLKSNYNLDGFLEELKGYQELINDTSYILISTTTDGSTSSKFESVFICKNEKDRTEIERIINRNSIQSDFLISLAIFNHSDCFKDVDIIVEMLFDEKINECFATQTSRKYLFQLFNLIQSENVTLLSLQKAQAAVLCLAECSLS